MLLVFHSQIKGAHLLYGRLVSLLKLKSISTMVFLTALNVLGPVHLHYFSLSRCHFAIELSHCFSRLRTSRQQFSYASLQHLKARPSLRQRVPCWLLKLAVCFQVLATGIQPFQPIQQADAFGLCHLNKSHGRLNSLVKASRR